MRPVLRTTLQSFLLILSVLPAARAADWLVVASDRVRRVELDRSSIRPSEAGTKVAWGRIVLSDDQAKAYGYRTVSALNRYDCRSHAFVIIKRVYQGDDESVLREDKVEGSAPIGVKTGTVDDRFFREVCRPASVAELRNTAKRAAEEIAKANDEAPVLRRADIRLTRDEPAAPMADKKIEKPAIAEKALDKPVEKPLEKSAPKAARPQPEATRRESKLEATTMAEHNAAPQARRVPPPSTETPAATLPVATVRAPGAAARSAQQLEAERAAERAAQQVAAMSTPKAPARATSKAATNGIDQAAWLAKAAAMATAEAEQMHWSYEGAGGPENWGKLDPEFSVCSNGKRQSPIDIRDGIKVDQEPIAFNYLPSYFRIVDNGHTIQVSYGAGSQITIMGRSYQLVQVHFHHPAEERINGKGFAMVAHLVHRDAEGRLAIVAVLLEPGQANRLIQTLWNNLPLEKNEAYSPAVSIQLAELLPAKRDYISYMGSLTTPPCTEGVLWLVMKQPVELSAEQIDVFNRFYPNNARPIQEASGRIIKESR